MATMKVARFTTAEINSLVMEEEAVPTPGEKEVLIQVAFAGVNRPDTNQRKGSWPPPPGVTTIIGLEVSGTVAALGAGVERLRLGDRVCALLIGGGYAEFAVAREDHVMRVPAGMTLREAATLPEVWLTGFQILRLMDSASASWPALQQGDVVLVHAASSGVGTALLQLLRLRRARVIATVGSDEKAELCRKLGAEVALNRKTQPDFAVAVKAATEGRGANVILDCVGGSYWEQNADALAKDGTWVVYGRLGGTHIAGPLIASIIDKRARLLGTTLRCRSPEYKAELISQFSSQMLPRFSSGDLRTFIFSELPLEQVGSAHELIEANAHFGKLVLRVGGEPAPSRKEAVNGHAPSS